MIVLSVKSVNILYHIYEFQYIALRTLFML